MSWSKTVCRGAELTNVAARASRKFLQVPIYISTAEWKNFMGARAATWVISAPRHTVLESLVYFTVLEKTECWIYVLLP